MASLGRLFFVVSLASLCWAVALASAGRWLLKRVRGKDRDTASARRPWRRGVEYTCIAMTLLSIAVVVWSLRVEPYWPEVTYTTIRSGKLHGRGIRIVHLSDLHSDPQVRLEDRIPGIVDGLRPDLVVFTGDSVNSVAAAGNFHRMMKAIAARRPTFAVKGNWEAWWMTDVDVFGGTGVVELGHGAVPLRVGGDEIWLVGASVEQEGSIAPDFEAVPRDRFSILLHHYPALAGQAASAGADLHLAGDTHGGQLRLPLLGALIRIHRAGVWYSAGLHRVGHTWLFVNRGIGMEGGQVPRARFMCRPEIAVIDLMGVTIPPGIPFH